VLRRAEALLRLGEGRRGGKEGRKLVCYKVFMYVCLEAWLQSRMREKKQKRKIPHKLDRCVVW
jgi:hypothetical protein